MASALPRHRPPRLAVPLLLAAGSLGCGETGERGDPLARAATAPPSASVTPVAPPEPLPSASSVAANKAAVPTPDDDWWEQPVAAWKPPDEPRIYAKTRFVWVRSMPDASMQWIGYLWAGGSVALRSKQRVAGPGCDAWVPIEPRGWVCDDGKRATTDARDPLLPLLAAHAARVDSPWIHRYGESLGTRQYASPPTWLAPPGAPPASVASSSSWGNLAPAPPRPAPALPDFSAIPPNLRGNMEELRPRSAVAYTRRYESGGREWYLAGDYHLIERDRVVLYPPVTFHGVHLGSEARLPLAFLRWRARPGYRREGTEWRVAHEFPRLSYVELTGQEAKDGDERLLETREPGIWLRASDAVLPIPQAKTPWGDATDGSTPATNQPEGRATWLEVSVLGGWLLAYEGTRPVFATLISPGSGGLPLPNRDPLETAATPTGRFTVNGKFVSATMIGPTKVVHSDVPWTQNFSGPYALHGAYWHNDWGQPKSGGCVNLSPIDARWLFHFTDPPLPPGWHGVRWVPRGGETTRVIIHR